MQESFLDRFGFWIGLVSGLIGIGLFVLELRQKRQAVKTLRRSYANQAADLVNALSEYDNAFRIATSDNTKIFVVFLLNAWPKTIGPLVTIMNELKIVDAPLVSKLTQSSGHCATAKNALHGNPTDHARSHTQAASASFADVVAALGPLTSTIRARQALN